MAKWDHDDLMDKSHVITAHVPPFTTVDQPVITNTPRVGETPEQTEARTAPRKRTLDGRQINDVVVRPAHYTRWVIEPITFIMRNKMEFWRGNIIKYVARAGEKLYDGLDKVQSEITDLRKAMRYAQMRINELEGKSDL